jgi:hypothetical protein
MSPFRGKPAEAEESVMQEVAALRAKVLELEGDMTAMRAQLEGDMPKATAWLQTKVWRQRLALTGMNRTIASQRFVLRTLEALGRGLTREEYLTARKALENEQYRARIFGEPAKV